MQHLLVSYMIAQERFKEPEILTPKRVRREASSEDQIGKFRKVKERHSRFLPCLASRASLLPECLNVKSFLNFSYLPSPAPRVLPPSATCSFLTLFLPPIADPEI